MSIDSVDQHVVGSVDAPLYMSAKAQLEDQNDVLYLRAIYLQKRSYYFLVYSMCAKTRNLSAAF